ncbi:MAG: MoxR family ATPase [Myxococcota bacterium]
MPSQPSSPKLDSPEALRQQLASQHYIADDTMATVAFLAIAMRRPLLIEGPAGVGKTELAYQLALACQLPMIRLQCYEGLDESKALYEWAYARQLLYIQLLKEKVSAITDGAVGLRASIEALARHEDAFFSERFLLPRPLLQALQAPQGAVLLIDEVDKSDPEFEAFLLEFLADFSVTIPELGTQHAQTPPIVVLTSNDQRDLSDALKRRCLYLYIDYPSPTQEEAIIAARIPEAGDALRREAIAFLTQVRRLALRKPPGISEALDWVRSLQALNLQTLQGPMLRHTLSALLKHRSDLQQTLDTLLPTPNAP